MSGYVDGFINGTLVPSVAANALTIAIKTLAGNDPSAADPVHVVLRNATAATGNYVVLAITAATSLAISPGSTLGAASNTPFRVWIVGFNDAGTFRLGAQVCTIANRMHPLAEYGVRSSVAEGGAGAADSAGVLYTDVAVASKAFRILGFMTWENGLTTAGAWGSPPTDVQLFGPGIPLPGQVIQSAQAIGGGGNTTSSTFTATSLAVSMSPTSKANPVGLAFDGNVNISHSGVFGFVGILRGGTLVGRAAAIYSTGGGLQIWPCGSTSRTIRRPIPARPGRSTSATATTSPRSTRSAPAPMPAACCRLGR